MFVFYFCSFSVKLDLLEVTCSIIFLILRATKYIPACEKGLFLILKFAPLALTIRKFSITTLSVKSLYATLGINHLKHCILSV